MCSFALMVLLGFYEASSTSARNRPHEPTTSKPVVPRGYVRFQCSCPRSTEGRDGELRRGGARRGTRRRGRGGTAGGRGARGRARRGRPRRRRVLVLRLHAVEGAAAPGRRSCARSGASPAPPRRSPASSTSRRCSTAATRSSTTADDSCQLPWLEDRGIKLFRGFGVLAGEKRVDGRRATSSRRARRSSSPAARAPRCPPIEGLEEAEPWTNREATTAKEVPAAVVILGGGVVRHRARAGLPLARRRGHADRGRAPAAPDRGGVRLRAGDRRARRGGRRRPHRPQGGRRSRRPATSVRVTMDDGSTAEGEQLVAALGRRPRTEELGLESVGLEGGGYVEVDENMQVPGHDVAVRDRRRQRPHPAHPHGQVPGAHRVRAHPRQPVARSSTAPTASSPRASCSPTRRSAPSATPRRPRARPGSTSTSSRSARRPTPAAPSTAATRPAPRACSSTRSPT